MKRARMLACILLAVLCAGLAAQTAADPQDYFYTDLAVWETMGLVGNLPAARPYPLQLVKTILETVTERGDPVQKRIAESHYRRIFGRIITVGGKSELAIDTEGSGKQLALAMSVDVNYEIEEFLTLSGSADGWATNKLPADELLPSGEESSRDIIEDNAKVGPFWVLPSLNSSVAVGSTEYYLNAGLMRGSFGPFQSNGVIVGEQALHTGQFDFAANKKYWGFNLSFYSLSATSADDTDSYYPEKFLSVHSFEARPFDWLSVSLLESVIYGGRLEPSYFLPFSPFMISQGITGFRDNSWLGGMFTVKPVQGVKVDGVLYADDLSFNDIIKLNWDTKWRLAGQLGFSYAPRESGIFTLASFDYTMVTPYTYTHRMDGDAGTSEVNYQNYLHAGKAFGAALDPNSDRVNLKVTLRPLEDVDFDLVGSLIRHGNVNEDISEKWIREYLTKTGYITDGTILNSSGSDVGHAYFYSTPFLSQETIQYIWQTGFDVTCRLPVLKSGGYMVFRFGYRFECNLNDGINSAVYSYDPSVDFGVSDSTDLTDAQKAAVDAAAKQQLDAWRAAATGTVFNNYLTAGFEYFF